MTRRRIPTSAAVAAAFAVVLVGCSEIDGLGGTSAATQPDQVIVWGQGTHPDLVAPNPGGPPPLRTRLLEDPGQRTEVLAQLPESIPASERATVENVDLATHVIVLGVYGKCTEVGRVAVQGNALRFIVENPEPDTRCVWAPVQVEVWSVDREALTQPLRFLDQSGRTPTN